MARLWLGCLTLLILSASGASAAGYDDFASGLAAVTRGDDDGAIPLFTAALSAGDLNANLVPVAYLQRGHAKLNKERFAEAIVDFTAALKLKADFGDAYALRGRAEWRAGDNNSAIADFTQAISFTPSYETFADRSLARWSLGDFDGADADIIRASQFKPTNMLGLIWDAMIRSRLGRFDQAAFALDHPHRLPDGWWVTLLDLYRGRTTLENVERSAGEVEGTELKDRQCGLDFFVAEWWIARKQPDLAVSPLQQAVANCPHAYVEYTAAKVELQRLHS
jgi:tetratricopeptide (TPR) repeat protein